MGTILQRHFAVVGHADLDASACTSTVGPRCSGFRHCTYRGAICAKEARGCVSSTLTSLARHGVGCGGAGCHVLTECHTKRQPSPRFRRVERGLERLLLMIMAMKVFMVCARIGWAATLAYLAALGCSGSAAQQVPETPKADQLRLVPEPPEMQRAEASSGEKLRCPSTILNTVVSSVPTKRGVDVFFSTESIPQRENLRQRTRRLVDMYNEVYGDEGERSSWAKEERAPEGSRVEFSIFTEPDLDPTIEPIPEDREDELRRLQERIASYVKRMQAGEACPLMLDLDRRRTDGNQGAARAHS